MEMEEVSAFPLLCPLLYLLPPKHRTDQGGRGHPIPLSEICSYRSRNRSGGTTVLPQSTKPEGQSVTRPTPCAMLPPAQ